MATQIELLADQLIAEGYCDNVVDARLAAIHIIVAAERHAHAPLTSVENLAEAE